jgi:lysophospholipase L1-like esterase
VWRDGRAAATAPAALGEGKVRLRLALDGAGPEHRAIVYLPEGMKPTVLGLEALGGAVEPAPREAVWLCYGDSIAEGYVSSEPALAWPARAGRAHGLDVVNLGYAGAARGEIVSAEQLARVAAGAISISHGTNCWTRIPHSRGMVLEGTRAFLDVVRQGHPDTPVVVASPVVRPDAETTPNRLGATLEDLRGAIEQAAHERMAAGDELLTLLPGRDLLDPALLADGIHPGDDGHAVLAERIGGAVADVLVGRVGGRRHEEGR